MFAEPMLVKVWSRPQTMARVCLARISDDEWMKEPLRLLRRQEFISHRALVSSVLCLAAKSTANAQPLRRVVESVESHASGIRGRYTMTHPSEGGCRYYVWASGSFLPACKPAGVCHSVCVSEFPLPVFTYLAWWSLADQSHILRMLQSCPEQRHNTIVAARAGKDLVSSLISGLATIGRARRASLDRRKQGCSV